MRFFKILKLSQLTNLNFLDQKNSTTLNWKKNKKRELLTPSNEKSTREITIIYKDRKTKSFKNVIYHSWKLKYLKK